MASELFLVALSTIAGLALCTAVLSLVLIVRAPSNHQLRGQVRQLDIDVEELTNAVQKWTNRGRVADARARIGQQPAAAAVPDPSDRKAFKAYLRSQTASVMPP